MTFVPVSELWVGLICVALLTSELVLTSDDRAGAGVARVGVAD
ncbi:hypothetical protein [Aeromicrobium sp. CFBP 8757]|nr:hypothetical protein [Aeromicrobium sp. CFBP 8757]